MADDAEGPVYYVVSDLHIGGDDQLGEVDFLEELLDFLERLETTDEDAELIVNGDAFGLWEFTEVERLAKFEALTERYPELFEQLRATGASIPITMLPGNHDHELAAYDEYVERLAAYNVDLVRAESITRPVGDRTVHFEHGNQQDPNNRFEDFGNPYETPMGYFYNTHVTSRAGRLSERGRYNWLKDVQAVTPTERVPRWLFSKYFYREMNPLLRYAVIPFLLLLNVSLVIAVLAGLDVAGLWTMPVDTADAALARLGLVGEAVHFVLVVNAAIAGLLILVGIPLYFFLRDLRQTVDRFGVFETDLTVDPEEPYAAAAREVFADHPETAIFCYGHTHRPGVSEIDGRLLVNSGTWLKRFHHRDVVAGVLPPVFYPSYQLCVVRISADPAGVAVEFEQIEKTATTTEEITRIERLLTLGREPSPELPDRLVVGEPTATPPRDAESVPGR
ncbi:metallophosphoesterase [Natrarchaeobaculum sulfurireducens]|uniref:Calcineurin family phosphoesterase n=1 Tax=Natrarchaeobaculum sulfurireducens TaxID=2044521 RepID=A0A346PQF4_9EURY|nr:metallophosphoesterase [Natrarchaeobaculum sulfurireducens]AXR78257.1 Calcineurin family phosphoesterase [Natrarchaeobaculum sulfurireducens]AXR81749.1 hypothetical protein AArcMg_1740 [Natrarchaeobaculum sulfurireducens]